MEIHSELPTLLSNQVSLDGKRMTKRDRRWYVISRFTDLDRAGNIMYLEMIPDKEYTDNRSPKCITFKQDNVSMQSDLFSENSSSYSWPIAYHELSYDENYPRFEVLMTRKSFDTAKKDLELTKYNKYKFIFNDQLQLKDIVPVKTSFFDDLIFKIKLCPLSQRIKKWFCK